MRQVILIITYLFCAQLQAQLVAPDRQETPALGTGIRYENTIYWDIHYVQHFKCDATHEAPYYMQLSLSTPMYLINTGNKNLHAQFGRQWNKNNWFVNSLVGVNIFGYEEVMANGMGLSADLSLQGGINKNVWFAGAEIGYKNNIFTTFNFENPVNDLSATTQFNTNGNYMIGAFGGFRFLHHFSAQVHLDYQINRDFTAYPPYTVPYGGGLTLLYHF